MKAEIFNQREAREPVEAAVPGSRSALQSESMRARERMLSTKSDPFLFADWERTVFLHYTIAPHLLRPHVPEPLEIDLFEGRGCVSVVTVTMTSFQPARVLSSGWLFRPVVCQKFLNLRTYVRVHNEPAALFLWGWISNPLRMRLPLEKLGLPCAFANLEYEHRFETGHVRGSAKMVKAPDRSFEYRALVDPALEFKLCAAGSLADFAMERYTGLFCCGQRHRLFRVWHPPWLQQPIQATMENSSLLTSKFPWFENAQLASANLAMGFRKVWLGRPHSTEQVFSRNSVLSAFYEVP